MKHPKSAEKDPKIDEGAGQGSTATNGYWLHDEGGPARYVAAPKGPRHNVPDEDDGPKD